MNTARDMILAILQGEAVVKIKKYKKDINWDTLPKKLGRMKKIVLDISPIQKDIGVARSTPQIKE